MTAELEFKRYVDRILRCRSLEDEAKQDTKDVYAEVSSAGYDKTVVGALVAELRKQEKHPAKFQERNETLDVYRDAYHRASHTHASAPARENITEFRARESA